MGSGESQAEVLQFRALITRHSPLTPITRYSPLTTRHSSPASNRAISPLGSGLVGIAIDLGGRRQTMLQAGFFAARPSRTPA